MSKPYLDIFGDWYYTKSQTSNKSRSLGIDTVTNFYQKYGVPADKREQVLQKFSTVFGSDYLFGDKNGVFGSEGKGVDICRPADVLDILPYLEMRLKTIETEKNIIPGSGVSVYKNRLDRIKKNIERYIALMKSAGPKMKVCEQVKGIEEPMTDQDMLQYLTKVLYFGIYPEKAEANIHKCVSDFRALPMKGALADLLAELKSRDADKLLSFLKMVSVAVASLPAESASMASIRLHLTELFDKLRPGLGTTSFSQEGPLDKQLQNALQQTDTAALMNAKETSVSATLEEEIKKILESGKTYPSEIVSLLQLLKDRKINEFIAELNKQYDSYNAQIEELKKELNALIGKLNKDTEDVEEKHTYTVLARLRRILGKKPLSSPGGQGEEEGRFEMINPITRYRAVVTPEKVGVFAGLVKKMKGEAKPAMKEINEIDAMTVDFDKKLAEMEAKNKQLMEEIEELKRKSAEMPDIKADVDKLVDVVGQGDVVGHVDSLVGEIEKINEGAVSDEVIAEINKLINKYEQASKKSYNIKELLEAIKNLRLLCEERAETPSVSNAELDAELKRMEEEIERNMRARNGMAAIDAREQYLNIVTTLIKNDATHMGMLMDIAGEYEQTKSGLERNVEVAEKLAVPEGVDFNEIFIEILDRLVYADAPRFDELRVDEEDLEKTMIEVAKLIMFMSAGGEGLVRLENYEIGVDVGLLVEESALNGKEPAVGIGEAGVVIMTPPAVYNNIQMDIGEFKRAVVGTGKVRALNVEKKEIVDADDDGVDIEGLRGVYSRRQLVNLLIALIKKYRETGSFKKRDDALPEEKVEEEEKEEEEKEETEEVPTKDFVEDLAREEVEVEGEVIPAETIAEETEEPMEETPIEEPINLMEGEPMKKEKVDIGIGPRQVDVGVKPAVELLKEREPLPEANIPQRKPATKRTKKNFRGSLARSNKPRVRNYTDADFTEFTDANFPARLPKPEELPNIPASEGEVPEHFTGVAKKEAAAKRLKNIFNSNIPVNNSVNFSKRAFKLTRKNNRK
jgi:uncharacterized protein YkvS